MNVCSVCEFWAFGCVAMSSAVLFILQGLECTDSKLLFLDLV